MLTSTETEKLHIREATENDIPLIADYWSFSPPEYLVSLGVDLDKLPARESFVDMLQTQVRLPLAEKSSYALIWEYDGVAIGHCNVNNIKPGESANMHLHIWYPERRRKGMGTKLIKMALPFFFRQLDIKKILCEPYALNAAPNKALEKSGFVFVKSYTTVPGPINFEQEVNQWIMTQEMMQMLNFI